MAGQDGSNPGFVRALSTLSTNTNVCFFFFGYAAAFQVWRSAVMSKNCRMLHVGLVTEARVTESKNLDEEKTWISTVD